MKLKYQFFIVTILVMIAYWTYNRRNFAKTFSQPFDLQYHLSQYQKERESLAAQREDLAKRWAAASGNEATEEKLISEAFTILSKHIPERIFPYWYDTEWDFNGTTQNPRQGAIACGYFVTTTLEHSGFKLPRVKMAQQAASVIIKSLCEPNTVKTYTKMPELNAYLDRRPNGLFILGLDNHVGFILKQGKERHFIHSTIGGGKKVLTQKLVDAGVVHSSKIKMIGDLTSSKQTLIAWIKGDYLDLK